MALLDDAANPNLRKVNTFVDRLFLHSAHSFAATSHCGGGTIFGNIWTQSSAEET